MTVLRVIAILVALGGVLDPALSLSRPVPTLVRLHVDRSDPDAADVEARLRAAMHDRLEFVAGGDADAHVVVRTEPGWTRPRSRSRSRSSPCRTSQAPRSSLLRPPYRCPSTASRTSLSPFERAASPGNRAPSCSKTARWSWRAPNTAGAEPKPRRLHLPYLALTAGARRLTVRVEPARGERRLFDNRVDVLAMAEAREGRVAVIEPRPSWPAGFVRRQLENEPAFRVASILRTATDVVTHAGESPRGVTLDQLVPFDVVIAGAPEEFRAAEVDALRQFAEVRGGTVVLLPDRRPTGAYAGLLPGTTTEQLLTEPRMLEPAGIPASEIVSIPLTAGVRPLASLNGEPVVFSWPLGAGRVIFSGALDGWRYRGDPRSRAHEFWRDAIMTAALAAPPRVRLETEPAVVQSGRTAGSWRGFGRPSSWPPKATRLVGSFAIEAHVTNPRGHDDIVRLHPTMERGTLEGSRCDVAAWRLRRHCDTGERRA